MAEKMKKGPSEAGRKTLKCPHKQGINLNMREQKGNPRLTLLVGCLAIVILAGCVAKFGVIDQVYYTGCSYPNIVKWNEAVPGGKSLLWIGKFPKFKDRFDPAKRAAMGRAVQEHFEKYMVELRKADFKYVTAVSLHTYWNPKDPVDPFIIGTDYLKKLIDEFHAHGVKVCSIPFEGGETEAVYHRLWELGCDGFSTDYPSVMFKVIRDLKAAAKK